MRRIILLHCKGHVDGATEWGIDLYMGLELWTFFQPQSQGVDLHVDCFITQEYTVKVTKSNQQKHLADEATSISTIHYSTTNL